MIKLNEKEKSYVDLRLIFGNIGESNETEIKPTYRITDWLKAKNISQNDPEVKDIDSNQDGFLDLTRKVEFSNGVDIKLQTYIEAVLTNHGIKPRGIREG